MECSEILGYRGRKHLQCKVGGVRVLGTPRLRHPSICTRRSSSEKTAEQAGRKGYTASAGVQTWLSNQGCTPLPEKAACGGQRFLCDGCTWSAVQGRAAVLQGCLCVSCVFCKDPRHPTLPSPLWHPPSALTVQDHVCQPHPPP